MVLWRFLRILPISTHFHVNTIIVVCGSPVEPTTLPVTNNNLQAHLADLLIYKQHFFKFSHRTFDSSYRREHFFPLIIQKRRKIRLFASLLPIDRMYTNSICVYEHKHCELHKFAFFVLVTKNPSTRNWNWMKSIALS